MPEGNVQYVSLNMMNKKNNMTKLFLDIGNSFVKSASMNDGYYTLNQAVKLTELLSRGLEILDLETTPDEVYFSSVENASEIDKLKSLIQSEWHLLAIQLTSQKSCCGLESGYSDFSALGDDRWFSMLGAIEIYKEPVLVVDAGTALTVDAIIDGQHKGGFIVPGLHTMQQSLLKQTADLERLMNEADSSVAEDSVLARDTQSAILGGTMYMAASFINHLVEDLNSQYGTVFKLVLTGGESLQILPLLDSEYELISDLVLQGMVYMEETVKKQ